jgi:hypothetical protein
MRNGRQKLAEIIANIMKVVIVRKEGLILANIPKRPDKQNNTPHQIPVPISSIP